MTVLSLALSFVLIVLAALHLMWALGWWFPIREEAALARAVVGTRGVTEMPGAAATSLVVVALLFAAAWPWFPPNRLTGMGLAGLATVFVARGVAGYLPSWRARMPEEPFATLDRRYYAPLCLALGAGFLILTFGALT